MQPNRHQILQFFKEKVQNGFTWFLPTTNSDDDQNAEPSVMEAAYSLVRFADLAYKYPEQLGLEGFDHTTKNGCDVRYFTHEAAEASFEGVIRIFIQNAVFRGNRLHRDGFADNDGGFISFSIGSSVVRSDTKRNQKSPSWGTTHDLPIRNQHLLQNGFDGKLHVRLFDHDKKLLRKDTVEPMGGTEIDLAELKTAGKKSHSLRIPLKGFFRNYMTVNFTTEYFSIHDAIHVNKVLRLGDKKPIRRQNADSTPIINTIPWIQGTEKIDMQPIAYFNVDDTNTQVWLWKDVNPDSKVLIVSFRGSFQLRDVLSNMKIKPSRLGDMQEDHYIIKPRKDLQEDIWVHGGYLECYNSVREDLLQLIYDITGWHANWNIMVTGHSLGGAVSTLAAFEFANRKINHGDRPRISHMTFASMCVGRTSFIDAFDKTVPNSIRVVNRDDPFPLYLRMFYKHTGGKVFMSDNGYVDLEEDLPDEYANSQDNDDTFFDNAKDAMTSFANVFVKRFGKDPLTDGLTHHLITHYAKIVGKSVRNMLQYSD